MGSDPDKAPPQAPPQPAPAQPAPAPAAPAGGLDRILGNAGLGLLDDPSRVDIPIGASRFTLLGDRFPLPARLRLTNAFGAGPGPTFVADLDPRQLVLHLMSSLDLAGGTVPGTPEGKDAPAPTQLVNPTVRVNLRTGHLDGWATVHVPAAYPAHLHPGTDLDVRVDSDVTSPWRWTVGASYGPLVAEATVRLHYDPARLATAAHSGLSTVGSELAAPGFTADGTARLGPVPVAKFGAEAASTRPRQQPLLGAPNAFPSEQHAYGVIVAPAGSVTSVAAPALGGTYARYGERTGLSATAALLPTLDPEAKDRGLSQLFPVHAYAEVSAVRRVSSGLELGLRTVLQVNSAELAVPPALPAPDFHPPRANTDPTKPPELTPPFTPQVGVTVFGRFSAF